ncbi:hypothetical protein QVD17_31127 [Tagetes erecta]|uniref:Uncharacterized protein n=1 Tax=Tagetes erecta TaxID=13708 RepID=A0AAD8K6H1_TARER|nr:hypothetical protein QVD17_31127 [Tagetes erecta]
MIYFALRCLLFFHFITNLCYVYLTRVFAINLSLSNRNQSHRRYLRFSSIYQLHSPVDFISVYFVGTK